MFSRREFLKILSQSATVMGVPSFVYALCPPQNVRIDGGGSAVGTPVPCAPTAGGSMDRVMMACTFESRSVGEDGVYVYNVTEKGGSIRTSVSGSAVPGNICNPRFVSAPIFSGVRGCRYHVPGTGGHFRSEHSLSARELSPTNWHGLEHYIGFAIRLDTSWPVTNPTSAVVFQLHTRTEDPVDASPVFAIRASSSGSWEMTRKTVDPSNGATVHHTRSLASYRADIGQWIRFVVHAKYHPTSGFYKVYRNGSLILDWQGIESYPHQIPSTNEFGYYKWGIYAAGYKTLQGADLTLYHDAIRITDSRGGVVDVDPVSFR